MLQLYSSSLCISEIKARFSMQVWATWIGEIIKWIYELTWRNSIVNDGNKSFRQILTAISLFVFVD